MIWSRSLEGKHYYRNTSTLKQYNNNDPRGLIGTKVPHCVWEPFNKRLFWQWKRTITYTRKTMFQYIITEKYIYIMVYYFTTYIYSLYWKNKSSDIRRILIQSSVIFSIFYNFHWNMANLCIYLNKLKSQGNKYYKYVLPSLSCLSKITRFSESTKSFS